MVSVSFGAVTVLLMTFLTLALPVLLIWVVAKAFQLLAWVLQGGFGLARSGAGRIGRFVRGMLRDALHFAGGLVTAVAVLPLALINVAIGRWSAAAHYGRAIEDELTSAALSLYRVALGHPSRLLGLGVLTDGVERRLPDLVARAPRGGKPRGGRAAFDGYRVLGTLPAGGSGARLFLARPSAEKLAAFAAAGHRDPGKVVIKSFALEEGSTLPQIVRESRALEAARRLGIVLDHELDPKRFHYVMPYVAGDDVDAVTARLHARSGSDGLSDRGFRQVLTYARDLLTTIERFHASGLWHKDIKPSNLIVSGDRVHVVDLGLVTPLASAMTLTTHGTEYFRDPELVRLALKGVRVHEVDGVKFDVYSAGAVLYSMIENSFPAHGSLSHITRRCPEALQWIVRRAMADLDARYASAREMLADLQAVADAADPFALRPADLPSVRGDFAGELAPRFANRSGADPALASPVSSGEPGPRTFRASGSPSGPAVRRRARRGVLGTAALLVILFGTARGLWEFWATEGRGRAVAEGSPKQARLVGALQPEAPSVAESRARNAAARWSEHLSPALPRLALGAAAPAVLVLADLPAVVGPDVLEGLHAFLSDRGYDVAGSGGALDERTLAWMAEARSAVGLSDPTDLAARARLQEFVEEAPLGAIVWIAGRPGDEGIVYHVARGSELSPEPARIVFEPALR